jgi:hypothetical protein
VANNLRVAPLAMYRRSLLADEADRRCSQACDATTIGASTKKLRGPREAVAHHEHTRSNDEVDGGLYHQN